MKKHVIIPILLTIFCSQSFTSRQELFYDELDSLFRGDLCKHDTENLGDLVQWMRNYKQGKEESEQVNFVGIDTLVDTMSPLLN